MTLIKKQKLFGKNVDILNDEATLEVIDMVNNLWDENRKYNEKTKCFWRESISEDVRKDFVYLAENHPIVFLEKLYEEPSFFELLNWVEKIRQ